MPPSRRAPLPVRRRSTTSITESTIGTIIAAVAVFDTHMLTNAVAAIVPATIAFGPRADHAQRREGDPPVEPPALDREREHETAEEQVDDVAPYFAVVRPSGMMPSERERGDRQQRGDLDVDGLGHPPGRHPRHHRQRGASRVGERDALAAWGDVRLGQHEVEGEREHRARDESDAGDTLLQRGGHGEEARPFGEVPRQSPAGTSLDARAPTRGLT